MNDLSPVASHVNLEELRFTIGSSEQVALLSGHTRLRTLHINTTQHVSSVDVSPLGDLLKLQDLLVCFVSAESLQRLAHLSLRVLSVQGLRQVNLPGGVLPRLSTTLRELTLNEPNGVSDLSSLGELRGL